MSLALTITLLMPAFPSGESGGPGEGEGGVGITLTTEGGTNLKAEDDANLTTEG